MDRIDFIARMAAASGTLDEKRLHETAAGCIERCRETRPDLKEGTLNMIGLAEECGELVTVVCQRGRGRAEDNFDILQEMADVILDIVCVSKVLGITNEELMKAINVKVDREADRILEHRLGRPSN